MIKLNLLPPSIDADRKRNIAVGVVVVLLLAEGGALYAARIKPLADNARYKQRIETANGDLSRLQKYGADVGPILAKESGLAPRFDFIKGLVDYNKAYPTLYKQAAGYTFGEVTLLNLEATSNQLKFDAYVTNPADVSRLLLGLSRNPDFQGLPIISNLPGFDEEEQRKRKEDEDKQTRTTELPGTSIIGAYNGGGGSDLPPGYGGGGGGVPGAAGGNGPGGALGMPGGNGPSAGAPAGAPGMGNGPGGAPGEGSVGMAGVGVGGSSGGGGNGPGGEGGSGGGSGDLGKFKLDGAVRKPRGFTVTVTCALKNPISRPSYGSSDQQAGGGGGGGGASSGGNGPGGGSFGGFSKNGP